MWGFAVAIDATAIFQMVMVSGEDAAQVIHAHKLPMTTDAVFLNGFPAGFADINGLWFDPERENRCMAQTIFGFEEIFAEGIIVRHVAIGADSHIAVRAVRPVVIVGIHHMAVDTGFRTVGEVGMGAGNVEGIKPKSEKDAHQNGHGWFPVIGRNQEPDDLFHRDSFICNDSEKFINGI
jgi:hypothetical protein